MKKAIDYAGLPERELDRVITERFCRYTSTAKSTPAKIKAFRPCDLRGADGYRSGVEDWHWIPSGKPCPTHYPDAQPVPPWSTSLNMAMVLTTPFEALGLKRQGQQWRCVVRWSEVTASTAARAVCLAVLASANESGCPEVALKLEYPLSTGWR